MLIRLLSMHNTLQAAFVSIPEISNNIVLYNNQRDLKSPPFYFFFFSPSKYYLPAFLHIPSDRFCAEVLLSGLFFRIFFSFVIMSMKQFVGHGSACHTQEVLIQTLNRRIVMRLSHIHFSVFIIQRLRSSFADVGPVSYI